LKNLLSKIPSAIKGTLFLREEKCGICNGSTGEMIAIVDYWDIKTSKLARCPHCKHIQLDPMLTEAETSKGCFAYYVEESLRTGREELVRNRIRNFRRGVAFGCSLKRKHISPSRVLELGPGSGYFSAGLAFVFPVIDITVMDVNEEVIEFNQKHHNYKAIPGIPDNRFDELTGAFDLVIARDIIEHVADISKVLSNINCYLRPGGYFHFITPNGHEDVWKHYLTFFYTGLPSELLINHVHYYDGAGLENLLAIKGFEPVSYYCHNFKYTIRGRGWKKGKKLMNPVSVRKSARSFIEKAGEIAGQEYEKETILDKWYIRKNSAWITQLYSFYHHFSLFRISPHLNVGHEFYGLFRKSGPCRD
jgi:SAM-dependent methyltransferase